jgi:hypothetical protein
VPFVQRSGLPHIIMDDDEVFPINRDGSYLSFDWRANCRSW